MTSPCFYNAGSIESRRAPQSARGPAASTVLSISIPSTMARWQNTRAPWAGQQREVRRHGLAADAGVT